MTTNFTASNGFRLDRFGAILAPFGLFDADQARTARLEWAQDALKEKTMSKPPTMPEFARLLQQHHIPVFGEMDKAAYIQEAYLHVLHELFLELLAKQNAPHGLPTEPGVYVDKEGAGWYLAESGDWWMVTDVGVHQHGGLHCYTKIEDFAPFTPIEEHINEEMGK